MQPEKVVDALLGQLAPEGRELVLFDVNRLAAARVPAGATTAAVRRLPYEWSRQVFSLSHVALPFPPDDPLHGYAAAPSERHVQPGRIEVRGEIGVLNGPGWMLVRQRSNPFHGYLVERVERWLGVPAHASPVAAAATS